MGQIPIAQLKDVISSVLGPELDARDAKVNAKIGELLEEIRRLGEKAPNAALDAVREGGARVIAPQKGMMAAHIIRAIAAAKNDRDKAIGFAKQTWGADSDVVKALAATDFSSGGALLPPQFSEEVIEFLRPLTAVRSLGPVPVDLSGGSLTIPKITAGASGGWVGENKDIQVVEQSTGDLTLSAKKNAALVPMSNDFLRRGRAMNDTMIRNDVGLGLAVTEDAGLLRGAGTQYSPRGLRYWAPAANVIPANATVNLANVTVDLSKLVLALENANVKMINPGAIMAPRTKQFLMSIRDGNGNYAFRAEMLQGSLWGWPFKSTTQVPTNLGSGSDESEFYLADFADAILGDTMQLVIEALDQATYPDPTTGNLVSAASRDQTVIRAISEVDFGMRHDASVAILTALKWL